MGAIEVTLEDIPVMYVESERGVMGSKQAFDELESKLQTLRGRKFYGVIFGVPPNDKYWASVAINADDNPTKLGLGTGVISGGKYIQTKLLDWSKNLKQVGKIFENLSKQFPVDSSRPSVEYYRSMSELIIRLPIK